MRDEIERKDVQGIVFSPYKVHPHACYLFARVLDPAAARAALRATLPEVTSASDELGEREHCVNVAFTAAGLAKLGLDGDTLATFPMEFRQGMHERARLLEDTPEAWDFGAPRARHGEAHVVFMVYARAADEARRRAKALADAPAFEEVLVQPGDLSSREHFGFADGISQPHPAIRPPRERRAAWVPAGEILLGYENAYGRLTSSPRTPSGFALGDNGTFLVVRKLEQDVARFWRFMFEAAAPRGPESREDAAVRLASAMVGRWPSGAPMARGDARDPGRRRDANLFGYRREDPHGLACPFGAHVRRANPRDMLGERALVSLETVQRHRILRRGRNYGPPVPPGERPPKDDRASRGLVFIALNANLRRQFELIQQSWIQNPCFHTLHGERDPLVGARVDDSVFTVPERPASRRVRGIPDFVRMRGGGYFFLPGRRALAWLSR